MRVVVLAAAVGLIASSARAAIYENTVAVDDEDDLFTLEQRGDISPATLDTLLELIREGVDLNGASREELYDLPGLTYQDVDAIVAYRVARGRIEDPAELVGAGALTAEQLVQLAPFLRLEVGGRRLPVSGRVRALGQFTATDDVAPPGLLSARLKGPLDLSAGAMLFGTRRLVATPTWDAATDALATTGFGYHLHLPRAFLQWSSGKRKLVVGTYTIGFAERLTLDNTRRLTPRGIYLTDDFRRPVELSRTCRLSGFDPLAGGSCTGGDTNLYITPDHDWREVFRGVAGSLEDVDLGGGQSLSLYGFLSYQSRSIYQYELYDRRFCEDPRDDDNDDCKAPPVSVGQDGSRLIFSTLPYLFDELTGGGHVTWKPSYRVTLGVTGYGALPLFHASPMQLDFQEWSRYPSGGAFGAVGVDAHTSVSGVNLFLEASRSFDGRVGGGGGFGAEQRTTWSPRGHELELSLRLYDVNFGTPYARPVSSPDELDGLRARNEAGARVRYYGRLSQDWTVRARVDAWVNPWAIEGALPAGVGNVYALGRVDFTGWRRVQPSLWVDARNRNLASTQRGSCASGSVVFTEGDPYVCNGDLYRLAARLEVSPWGRLLTVNTQGAFTWRDDLRYDDRFRNDVMLWAEVRSEPVEQLQLRLKARYRFEDVSDNTYLEQNLWTFLEASWLPRRGTRVGLRYDVLVWLDERASTATRVPNPEHRFLLDLRTSF